MLREFSTPLMADHLVGNYESGLSVLKPAYLYPEPLLRRYSALVRSSQGEHLPTNLFRQATPVLLGLGLSALLCCSLVHRY